MELSEVIKIRWSQKGEALMNGISALRGDTREEFCSLSHEATMSSLQCAVCNTEEGSHQNPIMLTPWPWTRRQPEL